MLRIALVLMLAPAAVVAAPVPKGPPPPTVATLKQALGKSHLGNEVRAIGRQLGEAPVIKYSGWMLEEKDDKGQEDTSFYLIWKAKGIDLHFQKGNLNAIWLFNEGADEHRCYRGELPEGLSFDDDRDAIEKKLGKPTDLVELPARQVLGKGPVIEEAWLDYPKGLRVTLRRPPDGKWTIHFISLQLVDDKEK